MRTAKALLAILAVSLVALSCASTKLRPLESGETRLTDIEMPDVVREDLQYEVILTVESEETPQIQKICFRWVAEENSSRSPSLHGFSVGNDFSKGLWHAGLSGPATTMGSDLFCVEGPDIRADVPGKLMVKIRPTHLKANYNKLESQAEYLSEGRLRTTNKIGTHVMVGE